MDDRQQQRPVIIVGGGPTGLSTALLLANHGVRSVVLEQDPRPQQHPAACILNTRTMEVFREIGVEHPVRAACPRVFEEANIHWVVSMAGRELGRCSALPDDLPAALAASPTHAVSFPQHKLEPLLWERAETHPLVDFRPAHRWTGLAETGDSVSATIQLADSERSTTLEGSYLIGCDGASSGVRRALGIEMRGPVLQHMLGLHFTADLSRYVDHRPGILYWVINERLMGVLIAHGLPCEWVLFAPYLPPQQTAEGFSRAACLKMIHRAIGADNVPGLALESIGRWTLAGQIADRYRQGRVFLAGDAAHTFPPTGGLGLNTGVQDGHNLAWKLRAVLSGSASPELLFTYESERRPVAVANRDQSVRNYRRMSELTRVVSLDLGRLEKAQAVQHSRWFRWLPSRWQLRLVEAAHRGVLGKLALFDAEGPRGERARADFARQVPGQAEHYRFLGIDLGFHYERGVVVPEDTPKPQPANPVSDYRPTTWPGSRLPHIWAARDGVRKSIHDFLGRDAFTLLTSPSGKPAWASALASVGRQGSMPVACLSVGMASEADLYDCDGLWPRLCEVTPQGAVLVRPDGHVAWRAVEMSDALAETLENVLSRLNL